MNYKPFPSDVWHKIETAIASAKTSQKNNKKVIAAFDADGTLWDCDLGENFFNYQIEKNLVPLPENPFDYYHELKKLNSDPRAAYVWLAQINQGLALEQIRTWADMAFKTILPSPIFSEQKKLIDLLLKNEVDVFIVTASIKWAVEPGARALGLSNDNVIGVETEVIEAIITDKPVFPITYRAGKVEALKKIIGLQSPFLCSGNSSGDIELLDFSSDIKLAVGAATSDDPLYKSEKELIQIAQQKNWLVHRFV